MGTKGLSLHQQPIILMVSIKFSFRYVPPKPSLSLSLSFIYIYIMTRSLNKLIVRKGFSNKKLSRRRGKGNKKYLPKNTLIKRRKEKYKSKRISRIKGFRKKRRERKKNKKKEKEIELQNYHLGKDVQKKRRKN